MSKQDAPSAASMERRLWLKLAGAAGAATLFSPGELLAGKPQIPRRKLGKTGKDIPILLLGGAVSLDPYFDPKIAEALRYGAEYIDAADCYSGGQCEPAVGNFHTRANMRDKLWITSKSDAHDPVGFEETLGESLRKLKTDHVDMYYLHALKDGKYLSPELEKTVARLKKSKKMLHFGFSCHGPNVAELLHLAARTPWVESVMFRYNFRQYGDKKLNEAMDAAHKAGVGLIAMKTQGSEASFADAWKKFQKTGKWNKHQAVLKAVWADKRITAIVSHMENIDMLRENIAAALDRTSLGALEHDALKRYASATRSLACDGCDHICGAAVDAPVQIGDTMRYLMYHDVYAEHDKARRLFRELPQAAQQLAKVDFLPANAACPHGVDVKGLMARACAVL